MAENSSARPRPSTRARAHRELCLPVLLGRIVDDQRPRLRIVLAVADGGLLDGQRAVRA
jgi:hypothetical protein